MDNKRKNIITCALFGVFFAAAFLACVFLPKKTYSDSERRPLAAMPEFSVKTVANGRFMSGFESYSQDAFPLRDQFRTLKALTATDLFFKKDNNGIYESGGYAAAMEYPMNEASLERAASRFRYVYDTCLDETNRVFFSVIPDKNCYMAQESGHLSMDYGVFEEKMAALMDFAQYIPVSDLLEKEDYYRTDTHWRQEKIVDVAQRLLDEMSPSHTPAAVSDVPEAADPNTASGISTAADPHTASLGGYHAVTATERFFGVYAGQSALPLKPEPLVYLTNDMLEGCSVYDWQNNREIPVYDTARADGKDPYELFLSGSLSLITIDNPTASSDRQLVLFRDSFGSSSAPLLVEDYARVTLADIRYIQPAYLTKLVDFEGCDVLFLYSTLVLNNSDTLK